MVTNFGFSGIRSALLIFVELIVQSYPAGFGVTEHVHDLPRIVRDWIGSRHVGLGRFGDHGIRLNLFGWIRHETVDCRADGD